MKRKVKLDGSATSGSVANQETLKPPTVTPSLGFLFFKFSFDISLSFILCMLAKNHEGPESFPPFWKWFLLLGYKNWPVWSMTYEVTNLCIQINNGINTMISPSKHYDVGWKKFAKKPKKLGKSSSFWLTFSILFLLIIPSLFIASHFMKLNTLIQS